jgi:glycosyltransferase involved in cell wall biosynthesis
MAVGNGKQSVTRQTRKLRVLFVPDSVYWVTGTLAKNMARFNPWIEATIASGVALADVLARRPDVLQNFDLVHFTCQNSSKQWIPTFRESIPCVTSHHHVDDWSTFEHNLQGDAIVVGAPQWAEDLRNRGADMSRVFCVPYGVDAMLFHPSSEGRSAVRKRMGLTDSTTLVGFFGKSSSDNAGRKGVEVFRSAIIELNRRIELAVLLVGPGWEDLTASLMALGVKCVWRPYLRGMKELVPMYQALDFYWVTSRVEGGPVTLLEAMSTEVCCLTTAVGIAKEVVRDGENGVILPFDDPQGFTEHTATLSAQPNRRKRMGKNARNTILKEMYVGATAKRIKDVYAKAQANFTDRTHTHSRLNIESIEAECALADRTEDSSVPLNGFPRQLHKRVRMVESLYFAEHLLPLPKQRSVAFKMIVSEWVANPTSSLPPRVFLRQALPSSWISRLVRLRNKTHKRAATAQN